MANETSRLLAYKHLSVDRLSIISTGEDEGQEKKNERSKLAVVSILVISAMFLLSVASLYVSQQEKSIHHHDHTIPTLLSIRNDDGTYINALESELYNEMKDAIFVSPMLPSVPSRIRGTPKINVDKELMSFHDNLTVTWDNEYSDDSNTVIALYCPASEKDPKQFRDAATLSQIQATMRAQGIHSSPKDNSWIIPSVPVIKEVSCEFRLWTRDESGDGIVYNFETATGWIEIKDGAVAPTTIHLALTEADNEMLVHFSTGDGPTSYAVAPVVLYGLISELSPDASHMSVGSTVTYSASDMCGAPANLREPGKFISPHLLHSVVMTNLGLDTRYYYKVGLMKWNYANNTVIEGDRDVWSDVKSFLSPMPAGAALTKDGDPLSYIVYADQGVSGYGGGDDGQRISVFTEREVENNGIRAVHHFGDLAYSLGSGHIWDVWLDMVSKFATSVPFMIGIGNHEYDHTSGGGNGKDPSGVETVGGYQPKWGDFLDDSNGECGIPPSKRFVMPDNGNGVYWYSYNYGLVHTIMISSEHDLSPGSKQYKWLEADLMSINRSLTPWVILEAHRPMYMIEDVATNTLVGIHMRKNFEGLLKYFHVDLYLAGHYHAYFRSCAGLFEGKCNNNGLTHITIGTAGAALDSGRLLRKPWSEFYSSEWGYGRITVENSTALFFEFVSDKDGSTKDSVLLLK